MSSAGPYGLIELGMLSALSFDPFESIRGTSAGSMFAVLLAIGIPVNEIIEYIVKRPLHKWFKLDITQHAFVSGECITELLAPLFHAYDVPLTITMKEFYERSNVDIYLYTTGVTELNTVELHHSTHPNLPIMTAVTMSCSIPIMFPPVLYEGEYYIDGALFCHCPPSTENSVVICIKQHSIVDMSSPFTFVNHLLSRSLDRLNKYPTMGTIYMYETSDIVDTNVWNNFLTQESSRIEMVEMGKNFILKKYEDEKR
jgi:NTE family protein